MVPKIRITHLITGLNTGGAEIALLRLLTVMDRQMFDAQVICMIPIGPVGEKIRSMGIPVTSLEMPPGHPTLRGFRQLLILLKRSKPDILQTWLYHADLMGLLAAKLAKIPTIIWNIRSAEMEFLQYRRLSSLVARSCALLSNWPTAVIVNSRAGQTIHTRLGYHPKEWIFIPNGIDIAQFGPDIDARNRLRQEWNVSEDEYLVGLVGRIDPQKDHPSFFKAAALAQKQNLKIRYVCVGIGLENYWQKMKDLAVQLNLSNLLWVGLCTDMPAAYNALDVLVSSSIGEGFPNVVAEAMACERPCVVTDVGDSATLIAGTGLSVPPRNPQALADAILRMLELSQVERAILGKKARQRIEENFSLAQMVRTYSDLYKELT